MIQLTESQKTECLALLEKITARTNDIQESHIFQEEVIHKAYLFRDFLRDLVLGRYVASIPYEVWLHLWAALFYFTEQTDVIPDARHDGLTDDLRVFSYVSEKYSSFLNAYIKFRSRS